jgi:hypothetical protein
MPNQPVGYTGTIAACPFDGYATPNLVQSGTYVDGTALYTIQCPICTVQIASQSSQQSAVNVWNLRIANTHSFVTWGASLAAEVTLLGTYAAWQTLYAAEVASAPTVAALESWITANPPPNIDTLVTWIHNNPPVTD